MERRQYVKTIVADSKEKMESIDNQKEYNIRVFVMFMIKCAYKLSHFT